MSTKRTDTPLQVGDFWLSKRTGSPIWQRTFWNPKTRQTSRVSLGTDDLETAKQLLTEWFISQHRPVQEAPAEVALADIMLNYYTAHGSKLPSAGNIKTSCSYWVDFHKEASVEDAMTIENQERFINCCASVATAPPTPKG